MAMSTVLAPAPVGISEKEAHSFGVTIYITARCNKLPLVRDAGHHDIETVNGIRMRGGVVQIQSEPLTNG
jgi:hypothetical protein